MLIGKYYDGLELYRVDKLIYGKLLVPHLVLTTCRAGGGQRTDLEYLGNHQSCEPAGHSHGLVAAVAPEDYHRSICTDFGLPAERCALLGTAANMRLAAFRELSFRDLTVVAAVTGGVEGNAGRAGDPAYGWEGPNGYEALPRTQEGEQLPAPADNISDPSPNPNAGTINILLFMNRALTPGALARSIITATEAKSVALQELNVNSRYSSGLATGTGTDQIGVAARLSDSLPALTSSGKHSKLGELIARSVIEALKEVLIRQNGMTAHRQSSVRIHLERFNELSPGRFGLPKEILIDRVADNLDPETADLFRHNYRGLFYDPMNVAQVAAMAAVRDKFKWGILPSSVYAEVMARQGALLAVEAGGRLDLFEKYHLRLAQGPLENSDDGFLAMAAKALAMGFADKWRKP
ncbi:MAG: adenosylcobinamide amidohydrolase [Deltaproteobacteria bacterium]|jgi:adenosylcobinamide amidohydrolase|nr:adenosylcobinamide amidohydrolase [Deltaproteobacteria bacterium]